jgi:hypothetical protein
MRLLGVSRSLQLAVFGQSNTLFVVAVYPNGPIKIVSTGSEFQCATVIGGELLLLGGADGSVSVRRLPELDLVSASAHHWKSVIAIAGNMDAGLIVSVDEGGYAVFETVFDHRSINTVRFESDGSPPQIAVFKSAVVAVGLKSELLALDGQGVELCRLDARPVRLEKYYDIGSREMLLVGGEDGGVILYDLLTFEPVASWEGAARFLSAVPRRRAFATIRQGQLVFCSFEDQVPSKVSAAVRDECEQSPEPADA